MVTQTVPCTAEIVKFPVQQDDSVKTDAEKVQILLTMKDMCKQYFEGIKEEASYESVTPERLAKLASLALEMIDHYEVYGN